MLFRSIKLALDGDLIRYDSTSPSSTELAVRSLGKRLDMKNSTIFSQLKQGDTLEFQNTEVYERVFRIIELVGAKAVKQSSNYADDRVADRSANVIAPPGRRLRRNRPLTLVRGLVLLVCLAAAVVAIFYGISLLPGTKVL